MTDKTCPSPVPFSDAVGKIIFLTFLFFLSFINRFIFAPLLPSISGDLGITVGQARSIFLFGSIGVAAGAMGSGFVSSSVNHKVALEISMLGAGLILFVCVFSRRPLRPFPAPSSRTSATWSHPGPCLSPSQ